MSHIHAHTTCTNIFGHASRGGQTVNDRQDKAALSPQSFRQADTKDKSVKRFPGLLSAKKTGYVTRFTVSKRTIGKDVFWMTIGSSAWGLTRPVRA